MTATVPPVEEPGAGSGVSPGADAPARSLMPISVNLLPEEIIRARVGAAARRVTVIVLLVVTALMGGWYFQARQAASSAQDSLDQANAQTAVAKRAQAKYAGVTKTKDDIQSVARQVKQLTKGDVSWAALVSGIRAQAPSGVTLAGLTATASAEQQAPDASGSPGTLVLTGSAPGESGVHQFADRLSNVTGVSSAFVSSVAASQDKAVAGVTFSISLVLNKKALNQRYAKVGTR